MSEWEDRLAAIRHQAEVDLAAADGLDELEEIRVRYVGRQGRLTEVLRSMGEVPPEDRPTVGRLANKTRSWLEGRLEALTQAHEAAQREERLAQERLDVTLPGHRPRMGSLHPLHRVTDEIIAIFQGLGFAVAEGPEVEWDWYNFEGLNIPQDHPARAMHDTFYITESMLLRTHTSPVQLRYMETHQPRLPVRIVVPGRVYRRDDDATHSPMFHQLEGLLVDEGVSMAQLKGVLLAFAQQFFGQSARIRMRPSYFPFTEPSAEVDVSCTICDAQGCRTCSGKGWLEILGAGMVHPNVLKNGGYDPEKVSGFAFGMGLDRITMLRHGIHDLRLFFENDLRFLSQFGGR